MNLGELLKAERTKHGLSLREAAKQMQQGYGHLCDVETGKRPSVAFHTLLRYQQFYNLRPSVLWDAATRSLMEQPE